MSLFSFLGLGNTKLKSALRNGGIIIDVRSPGEYDRGRIPDSINIPVDRIPINAERLKAMKRPLVFCCSTGDRSNQAVQYMRSKGATELYNGGNWHRLLRISKSVHY
jgi:phage shock protein E